MVRQPKRDKRPALVECVENEHRFTVKVWKLGHDTEEGNPESIIWRLEKGATDGVRCPEDGSRVVPLEE